MSTTKALVVLPDGKTAGIQDVPAPKLREDGILVRTKAVALNPADWKLLDNGMRAMGGRIGYDCAGIVEKVGSKTTRGFKKGDLVVGASNERNPHDLEAGSFAELVSVKETAAFKMPSNLSVEQAATLNIGLLTCAQGLYETLKFPLPNEATKDNSAILMAGGSTSTGVLGIQFTKASGLFVIATASAANFDLVKSLGADAVFDYKSPTAAAEIRALTGDKLQYAWNLANDNSELIAGAMSSTLPGKVVNIDTTFDGERMKKLNPQVGEPVLTAAFSALGDDWSYGGDNYPANPEEAQFAAEFLDMSRDMLEAGKLRPMEPTVNRLGEGLEGVLKGLDELRAERVRATKLVYTL